MQKRIKTIVSKKDEYVPKGYIPIYSLFSYSKYRLPQYTAEEWCLSEKKISEMRRTTFKEVNKRRELSNAESFADFWNGNLDNINALGLNEFDKLFVFKELSTVMVCFEKMTVSTSRNKRKEVSWGINEQLYREYYTAQLNALKTGETPQKVNLYDKHKKRKESLFKLRTSDIVMGDKRNRIKLEKNALYEQFKVWCKAQGITITKGVFLAMENMIKAYPLSEVKDRKVYARKTELDYMEVVITEIDETNEYQEFKLKLPKELYLQTSQIVRRFNFDPENETKTKLTIHNYIAQAVAKQNKAVSKKYNDPAAYDEYMKLKEIEKYNK